MSTGVTLDAGPLIRLDRADRRVLFLLARSDQTGDRVARSGQCASQAIRDPARQARLALLPRQPRIDVVPLGRVDATNVGRLLDAGGTSDVMDAHVVVRARGSGTGVVTSDPDDPPRLDPRLSLTVI